MPFLIRKINLNIFFIIFFLFFSHSLYSSIFDYNNKIYFYENEVDKDIYKTNKTLNFYKLNESKIESTDYKFDHKSIKKNLNTYTCNVDYSDLVITLNKKDFNKNYFLSLNNEKILIDTNKNNSVSEDTKLLFYLFKIYPKFNETRISTDQNSVTIFYKNKKKLNNFVLEYSNDFSIEVISYKDLKHNELSIYSSNCHNFINIFDDNKDNINKLYLSNDNFSFLNDFKNNKNYYSFYKFHPKQAKVIFCENITDFKLKYIFTRLNNVDCYSEISSFDLFISSKVLDVLDYNDGFYLKLDNNIRINNSFFTFFIYSILLSCLIYIIIKNLYFL